VKTILFFDLDATLVENHFSRKVFSPLLQEIADETGVNVKSLWKAIEKENQRRQKEDPDNPLTMDWDDLVKHLAKSYGINGLSDTVDNLWKNLANIADIELLDNAPLALAKLKKGHRQLVLATKGLYKYQEPILSLTGLDKLFDDILTPDRTAYLKTSPQFFDKYRHEEALFIQVGDHFYDDVVCAKRNGFYSVMRAPLAELLHYTAFERPNYLSDYRHEITTYPREGSEIRPDALILSLQELDEVISAIEASYTKG
jgi:FMN phosphatase YigB (HAD superfamily)